MRLLLAEDDPILADALVNQLTQAGSGVAHAANGAVAEYLLTRQAFEVAELDIGLPMVDGLTVLKRARAAHPGLPVLLLPQLVLWLAGAAFTYNAATRCACHARCARHAREGIDARQAQPPRV